MPYCTSETYWITLTNTTIKIINLKNRNVVNKSLKSHIKLKHALEIVQNEKYLMQWMHLIPN